MYVGCARDRFVAINVLVCLILARPVRKPTFHSAGVKDCNVAASIDMPLRWSGESRTQDVFFHDAKFESPHPPHSSGVQCGVRTNPGGARCSAYVAGGSNDGKIV